MRRRRRSMRRRRITLLSSRKTGDGKVLFLFRNVGLRGPSWEPETVSKRRGVQDWSGERGRDFGGSTFLRRSRLR
eukprot:4847315-Pyramimonas_sp.AAC.1